VGHKERKALAVSRDWKAWNEKWSERTLLATLWTLILGAGIVLALSACSGVIRSDNAASHPLPNHKLTPGAFSTQDLKIICNTPASSRRNVTQATKNKVYAEYGISDHTGYVIDHLVPLEDGGANDILNLWPQKDADAKLKDKLELRTHTLICSGQVTPQTVQGEIVTNWYVAYKKYVVQK
jgi:hypothetical protein